MIRSLYKHMEYHEAPDHMAKSNSVLLKWIFICLGIAVSVLVLVTVFKVKTNNLLYVGVLLLCPLMHFFMMKNGGHKH